MLLLPLLIQHVYRLYGSLRTSWFNVPLDHAAPWSNESLALRYLLDTSTHRPNGPLVVYTGNEAAIETFSSREAAGFLYVIASRFGGAVAFIEERYYGESVPVQQPRFGFLSSVQVIADYALVIASLRRSLNTTRVLAVGGSYGGMLAAWLRKQHPDLVSAALASSAPLLGFASTLRRQHRDSGFYDVTECAYASCRNALGSAFRALWAAPKASRTRIDADFGLCANSSVTSNAALEGLIGFLQQQLSDIAFINYPYVNGAVPANPAEFACSRVPVSSGGWLPLRDALAWHYQQAGQCLSLQPAIAAYTPGFLPGAWTFQRCTDLVMAFSVPANSTLFLSCGEFAPNCADQGMQGLRAFCRSLFGVSVPDSAMLQDFWGSDWSASAGGSRIIFSNGNLDPWSYGGVPDSVAGGDDGPHVLHIASGAHHIDLRAADPHDPPDVTAARATEADILGRWLGVELN
jgi:pimeloyl-ACP methyl ester carboxylesterase